MNEGLGGWLVEHKRGDIIEDISQDARWVMLPDDQEETGTAIGVPLTGSQRTCVGVLIFNHPQPGYFRKDHFSLLEAIATTVSSSHRKCRFF